MPFVVHLQAISFNLFYPILEHFIAKGVLSEHNVAVAYAKGEKDDRGIYVASPVDFLQNELGSRKISEQEYSDLCRLVVGTRTFDVFGNVELFGGSQPIQPVTG